MNFTVKKTALNDVLIIKPKFYKDNRGLFYESYNEKNFHKLTNLKIKFVQDNHSISKKGVLRGLHYQIKKPQGKLIRVTKGSVFDVCVDLRKQSPTFGKWVGFEINDKNKLQLWIPKGFAHGFLVLEDNTEFLYKTTQFRFQQYERTISWNDRNLNIKWPSLDVNFIISLKDRNSNTFEESEVFK